jgi:Trypsin
MNDIALMKLKEPLKFSESIKPIQFATEEVPEGANVTIVGWGKVSSWGSISEKLKFNTLQAVGQDECARASGIDFEGLLCLGHSSNNGACNVSITL